MTQLQLPLSLSLKVSDLLIWLKLRTTYSRCDPIGDPLTTCFICHCLELELEKQLQELRIQNHATQGFKYTKKSAANVISGIRQYMYFTLYFKLTPLPASEDTLVCFLEFMARTVGYPHLKHLLSSVKFLHQALNYSFSMDSFQLDMTMQGLKRRLAKVPFQVLPLTPEILKRMFQHLDMRKSEDRALWCSYLSSFYGLLRKSSAVPESRNFDAKKVLVRRNVKVDAINNMVYFYLGYGKTNNFCTRDVIVPVPGNNDPALDPVRHLQALFSTVQAAPDDPAFNFAPGRFVSYSSFTSRLKTLLKKAGYDPSLYSGHSFRRGGASFLHACGGTALMVQACGDWSSQCFTRYLYMSEAERLKSQSLISSGINALYGTGSAPLS